MFRKLSILILSLIIISDTIASSKRKAEDDDNGLEGKRAASSLLETSMEAEKAEEAEVSINLSAQYRKDKVVQLSLAFNPYLDNVSFLLGFPHLIDLDLSCCENLGDNYRAVSQLTNLERLNLHSIGLTTTEYLMPLLKLRYLKIWCPDLGKCIAPLAHLNLKELDISGIPWKGLVGLSQLISLESITFRSFWQSDEENEEFPSLEFLIPLVNLNTLDLSSNLHITHISPLVNVSNLTSLNLSGCHSMIDLGCIKDMKLLKELDLSNLGISSTPSMKEGLVALARLDNLRKLIIRKGIRVPDSISPLVSVISN